MCVYSMIVDQKYDDWQRRYIQPPQPLTPPPFPWSEAPWWPGYIPALPTQTELDEFRRLLEAARAYDKRNKEPECEEAEKRKKLQELADLLGVKIKFPEKES